MQPIISGPPGPNLAFSGNRESLYFFNRPSTTFNLGEVTPKPWKAQDHFFQRRQLRGMGTGGSGAWVRNRYLLAAAPGYPKLQ